MKLSLTIILFTFLSPVNAQTETDSSKNDLQYFSSETIDSKKLLGRWESTDSVTHQIEFLFHKNVFMLRAGDFEKRQFISYEFFKTDSSSMVSSNGVIIKWPPDYCYVKLIDENNIKVSHGSFGDPAILIKYRRIQKNAVW